MEGWLTGWKAIAQYIGRSVKTTKKYHKEFSMTVRRGPGNVPIALPYEIDKWLVLFDELKAERKINGQK